MNDIKLRDYFAGQLIAGKVNDFYCEAHRENISKKEGEEQWVQVSAYEATRRAIEQAAEQAYVIADALVQASYRH